MRVWQMDSNSGRVHCVAWGSSHTNAVGSISFSRYPTCSHTCFFSYSYVQKRAGLGNDLPCVFVCVFLFRMKASFIVSGSQDCTLKVWDLPVDLTTTGEGIHQLMPRTTEKAHDKVQTSIHTSVGKRNKPAVI